MKYIQSINDHLAALRAEKKKSEREMKCVVGRNTIGQRQGLAFRIQQIDAEIAAALAAKEDFKTQLAEGVKSAVAAKAEQYNHRYGGIIEALMQWRDECHSAAKDARNTPAHRLYSARAEARINGIVDRIRTDAPRTAPNPKADPAAVVGGSASSALIGADHQTERKP